MNATMTAQVLSPARADVISFARHMTANGSVTVTSPAHPDLVENRLAIHDTEASGYSVIFITVIDGVPETNAMNFDLDENIARRHLLHDDGLGLTLFDVNGRALVTYRIG